MSVFVCVSLEDKGTGVKLKEQDILTITGNGFTREQAIEELTKANGDLDSALVALVAKSFKMPNAWHVCILAHIIDMHSHKSTYAYSSEYRH